MHRAKSLIPLALLISSPSLAAQLSDDLVAELDAAAAGETGEQRTEEPAADPQPDEQEQTIEGEEAADPNGEGEAGNDLIAKLASLAAEGDAEAAYHLGMAYHLGANGAKKDLPKAFELFKQSAEAGNPLGAYMLGSYYAGDGGNAVEADAELALKHKLAAADAGHALAQHDVAQQFYERGETDKALDYLLASAKQGYLPSLQALASLYSGEGKVAKDPVRQFAYVALLQGSSGDAPSKRLQEWRDKMQAELSEEQLKQAVEIVQTWKTEPSEVTQKALSGEAAALKLLGLEAAAPEPPKIDSQEAPEGR
ncbi:tetratricopeptide repeat protein [Sphingosinicella humi]|nr:SEL1-like repeat protein [Sphingosinicella humi]